MFKRKAVTIRLNQAEQFDMLNLLNFWGKDEKGVIKLAIAQLIKATNELQKRLQEAEANENNNNHDGSNSNNISNIHPDVPVGTNTDQDNADGSAARNAGTGSAGNTNTRAAD